MRRTSHRKDVVETHQRVSDDDGAQGAPEAPSLRDAGRVSLGLFR